nr:uncharacterized protein LOC129467591 [Symphalangus syndactylus]
MGTPPRPPAMTPLGQPQFLWLHRRRQRGPRPASVRVGPGLSAAPHRRPGLHLDPAAVLGRRSLAPPLGDLVPWPPASWAPRLPSRREGALDLCPADGTAPGLGEAPRDRRRRPSRRAGRAPGSSAGLRDPTPGGGVWGLCVRMNAGVQMSLWCPRFPSPPYPAPEDCLRGRWPRILKAPPSCLWFPFIPAAARVHPSLTGATSRTFSWGHSVGFRDSA